jgi:hypothetical protein
LRYAICEGHVGVADRLRRLQQPNINVLLLGISVMMFIGVGIFAILLLHDIRGIRDNNHPLSCPV